MWGSPFIQSQQLLMFLAINQPTRNVDIYPHDSFNVSVLKLRRHQSVKQTNCYLAKAVLHPASSRCPFRIGGQAELVPL